MKINTQWRRHVEAWRESGLSQADYCRQQGLNRKTFSVWTRRVQVDLSLDKDAPLELLPVQVEPSAPVASAQSKRNAPACARVPSLNCPQRCRLVGWRNCFDAWLNQYTWANLVKRSTC